MSEVKAVTIQDVMDELRGEAPAFVAMMTSPGYALWEKYAEVQEQAFKEAVFHAEDFPSWQKAKSDYEALRKARLIPQMLLDKIRNLDSAEQPTDAP